MPQQDGHPLHQRISNLKRAAEWREALRLGRIRFRAGTITGAEGRRLAFADGAPMDADVVVLATGYHSDNRFPFLPDGVRAQFELEYQVPPRDRLTALVLHRRIMHPVHPTLCLLGQVTGFGNESAVGQLQARWALRKLARGTELAEVRRGSDALAARLLRTRPLFPAFVNHINYCDALARDGGFAPPALTLGLWLTDPRLAWALLFGPVSNAQYAVDGTDRRSAVLRSRM